jgi:copper(I)-binding protein
MAIVTALTACERVGPNPNASIVVASISITDARIPESPTGERLAVYAEIENSGRDDTLIALRADIAEAGSLHLMEMSEGMMTMRPTLSLDLPAGKTLSLRTGGAHGMLEGLSEIPEAGAVVEVTFVFESGTEVLVPVPVVSLSDLVNGA